MEIEYDDGTEDKVISDENLDRTLLGITGSLISLDTYVDEPFPLRSGSLTRSEKVRVGQNLIIKIELDFPIDEEDPDVVGGFRLIFRDADTTELVARKFIPISIGNDSGRIRFSFPDVGGDRSIVIIARPATRRRIAPFTITLVSLQFFRVANLRVIP